MKASFYPPKPQPTPMSPGRRVDGFTLLEIMVASAVLILLLAAVVSLVNSAALLTTLSNREISATSEARQALDRMGVDFSSAILRRDLPALVEKEPGNDAIYFYSAGDGYVGDRGISVVGFFIEDDRLHRGVTGTSWEAGGSNEIQMRFNVPLDDFDNQDIFNIMESEIMGRDIFRFELAFLMIDGEIRAEPILLEENDEGDDFDPVETTNPLENVRAVIVGIAALDDRARRMMTGNIATLAGEFPDAVDNQDILSLWGDVLDDPSFYQASAGFPSQVKAAVRIYQRFYYLDH